MRLDPQVVRRALAHAPIDGARPAPAEARPAAVSVPLMWSTGPVVLLVERAKHLREHAGEVAFPGGKPEAGDGSLYATALRETSEEVGLRPAELSLLGTLRSCPVISGRYLIHPFVVAVREGAVALPSSSEVARVLELPLEPLLRGDRRVRATPVEWRGQTVLARHLEVDGALLFGATAVIFFDLVDRLAQALGLELPPPELVPEAPWRSSRPKS